MHCPSQAREIADAIARFRQTEPQRRVKDQRMFAGFLHCPLHGCAGRIAGNAIRNIAVCGNENRCNAAEF
jgi:hypothetical protein